MQHQRRGFTITQQLLGLAIAPMLLLGLVLFASLYGARMREIDQDLADRGKLLAVALAETARYGVMAGNSASLQAILDSLVATQDQVAALEVLDARKIRLAHVQTVPLLTDVTVQFEQPILTQPVAVDLSEGGLGATTTAQALPADRGVKVGYVRVVLTKAPLVRAKRLDLLHASAVTALAAIFCGLMGLAIAYRLRYPLKQIMQAVRAIRGGVDDIDLPTDRPGEIGELQRAIVEMAKALSSARHDLEAQVASRTADLQDAVNAARIANEDRSRLIAHSHAQIEAERERIARELHDELGSMLVALRLKAQHIAHLTKSAAGPTLDEVARLATELGESLSVIYKNARALIDELRPEMLDALGLRAALVEMIKSYDTLHSDCHWTLLASDDFPELRGPEALVAYRLLQEALTNVLKHSGATRARVTLEIDSDGSLKTVVFDNGRGFDPSNVIKGRLGILGMRERLSAIGGSMEITSNTSGTTLVFRIPLGASPA